MPEQCCGLGLLAGQRMFLESNLLESCNRGLQGPLPPLVLETYLEVAFLPEENNTKFEYLNGQPTLLQQGRGKASKEKRVFPSLTFSLFSSHRYGEKEKIALQPLFSLAWAGGDCCAQCVSLNGIHTRRRSKKKIPSCI